MPAGWRRKLRIWLIAVISVRNLRDFAATWNNFARRWTLRATWENGWIFYSRNSTARQIPCWLNQPKYRSKTQAWLSKLRLRNCVNKCKMLNERTKTEAV